MRKRPKSEKSKLFFTKDEENSLILFTAGLDFGLALVGLTCGIRTFSIIVLIVILFVLLYIDYRIRKE